MEDEPSNHTDDPTVNQQGIAEGKQNEHTDKSMTKQQEASKGQEDDDTIAPQP